MPKKHPLLPNLDETLVSAMLAKVGAGSVEDLFSDIPKEVRLRKGLGIPEGRPEHLVRRDLQSRLSLNRTPPNALCFLGGGVWPHYVPAVVESVLARQEFYTSYTPYQAEVSQGMLQALFEYQSLVCDLFEMEACNSSMYDWASAAGEAVRMAVRVTGRSGILLAGNIGPERREVVGSYVDPLGLRAEQVPFESGSGRLDLDAAKKAITKETAAVYFETPNYFGGIETGLKELAKSAHDAGALLIAGVDPISLSLINPPGSYGADIAVGEGQPLGVPMNYGGPHLGVFAVKDLKLARSMPGRLIGMTTTTDQSQKAFAMVLQAREQHIRREAATSNVCTNQSLMAVAAASYLSLLGKSGFRRLGEVIVSNSHKAARRLSQVKGASAPHFDSPFFKEFTVRYAKAKAGDVYHGLAAKGIMAGYPLDRFALGSEVGGYCVTEVHTDEDVEALAVSLEEVLRNA